MKQSIAMDDNNVVLYTSIHCDGREHVTLHTSIHCDDLEHVACVVANYRKTWLFVKHFLVND